MTLALPVYDEDTVRERLARELPNWWLEAGTLRRKVRTSGWKSTLMAVNTIGHLAEAAWHHPDLSVSYAMVTVKLCTHSHRGITERDFALAHKIEEVVFWRPGLEGGALEGTPQDDPRLRYLKFDDGEPAAG